jgi:hypothetical protein
MIRNTTLITISNRRADVAHAAEATQSSGIAWIPMREPPELRGFHRSTFRHLPIDRHARECGRKSGGDRRRHRDPQFADAFRAKVVSQPPPTAL